MESVPPSVADIIVDNLSLPDVYRLSRVSHTMHRNIDTVRVAREKDLLLAWSRRLSLEPGDEVTVREYIMSLNMGNTYHDVTTTVEKVRFTSNNITATVPGNVAVDPDYVPYTVFMQNKSNMTRLDAVLDDLVRSSVRELEANEAVSRRTRRSPLRRRSRSRSPGRALSSSDDDSSDVDIVDLDILVTVRTAVSVNLINLELLIPRFPHFSRYVSSNGNQHTFAFSVENF